MVSIAAALKLAEEAELDLVEIAPTAKPPVCRVMDFGKFKYRESKRLHEAKLGDDLSGVPTRGSLTAGVALALTMTGRQVTDRTGG